MPSKMTKISQKYLKYSPNAQKCQIFDLKIPTTSPKRFKIFQKCPKMPKMIRTLIQAHNSKNLIPKFQKIHARNRLIIPKNPKMATSNNLCRFGQFPIVDCVPTLRIIWPLLWRAQMAHFLYYSWTEKLCFPTILSIAQFFLSLAFMIL